jgi:hypothetical protein
MRHEAELFTREEISCENRKPGAKTAYVCQTFN